MSDVFKNYFDICILISEGKIDSFSSLKNYLISNKIKVSNHVLDKLFFMVKKIHWGIFSEINFEEYPKLWKELVVLDPKMKFYGDLKRSMMISSIFVAILDIHGYTSFCQRTKKNITALQRLDDFVNKIIKEAAKKYGVLAVRERGDEVVLIGADAVEILSAVFEVVKLFSKNTEVSGDESFFLPPFEISGGVAGGYISTPLIIGKNGDLQGFLLNMAARLQARANALDPSKTKIIVDQSVFYKVSTTKELPDVIKNIKFLYNGNISFKGVSLKVYEAYTKEEKYKIYLNNYVKLLNELIAKNEWKRAIFTTLCDMVIKVMDEMQPFQHEIHIGNIVQDSKLVVNNEYISNSFLKAKYLFTNTGNYKDAVIKIKEISGIMENIPEIDGLVKEYCKSISDVYYGIVEDFEKVYMSIVKDNPSVFLSPDEMELLINSEFYNSRYSRVIDRLHADVKFSEKRNVVWVRLVSSLKGNIQFQIYSGKK